MYNISCKFVIIRNVKNTSRSCWTSFNTIVFYLIWIHWVSLMFFSKNLESWLSKVRFILSQFVQSTNYISLISSFLSVTPSLVSIYPLRDWFERYMYFFHFLDHSRYLSPRELLEIISRLSVISDFSIKHILIWTDSTS